MEAHKDVERRLRLPDSITSLVEYERTLLRFYQLYLPLETMLRDFPDWSMMGFEIPGVRFSSSLAADLGTLGVLAKDPPAITAASLPSLPNFACAVGAIYVLEGSALGSQYILPSLQRLLGQQIEGADTFFKGRGEATGSYWKVLCRRLDEYGAIHPDDMTSVVAGANSTFTSIGTWMRQ